MSTPHIIMWAIVLAVGVPSAWRNPTAAALVLCWIVAEAIFVLTGNSLAVEYYAYPDIFVLAVIFAKQEHCSLKPYQNTWHQFKCVVLERSPADRLVMLIFPVMWWLYAADIGDRTKWWALWFLAAAQFLLAGAESLSKYLKSRAQSAETRSAGEFKFGWVRGYG